MKISAFKVIEIDDITLPSLVFDQEGFDAKANKRLGEFTARDGGRRSVQARSWPLDRRSHEMSDIIVSTLMALHDEKIHFVGRWCIETKHLLVFL